MLTVELVDRFAGWYDRSLVRHLSQYPRECPEDNSPLEKRFIVTHEYYDPEVKGDRAEALRRLRYIHKIEIVYFLEWDKKYPGFARRYGRHPLPRDIIIYSPVWQSIAKNSERFGNLIELTEITILGWEAAHGNDN